MRAVLLALGVLAACGPSAPQAPPPKTEGQLQREKVDAAIKVLGDCVLKTANTMDVDGAVGPLVQKAVKSCPAERAALKGEVEKFYLIGNSRAAPDYVAAVAETSVKSLESDLREQSALAILNRQDTSK